MGAKGTLVPCQDKGWERREGSIYFKKTINTCQEKSLRQSKSKDTFFMSFDEDKNYTVSRFVFTSTNKNINLSY